MTFNDAQFEAAQRMGRLLYRRRRDELSEEERSELEEWLARQDHSTREFLEEVTEWEQIEQALHTMYSLDVAAALEDVQKKIESDNSVVQMRLEEDARPGRRLFGRLAAAAVIILVAGAGVMFYLRHHTKKVEVAKLPATERFRNEVGPGGQKAILQLADGSKIVLDNAANGELAQQGATKVIKLDSGEVTYRVSRTGKDQPNNIPATAYNTITTPKGGQYRVVLPDGSKVWLNAASSLRFPAAFGGGVRSVELSGEAYFEVARNTGMPFRVDVTARERVLQVDVLGTEFNINAYADEADEKTTLISGAVKVSSAGRQLMLQPGQQARAGAAVLKKIDEVNTEEVLAWKNGLFKFQDSPIESIMRQVSRWYDVEVVYDGKVEQQFVGTIPRDVNLTTLLKILESTGWVHFTVEGKKITVYP